MTYQFYRQADGIILTFDLTNESSFKNTKGWLLSIYKHCEPNKPKLLCGNKLDLIESSEDYVQDDAAKKVAEDHHMKYFKTSAFRGDNIPEMISYMINQVYESKIKPELE